MRARPRGRGRSRRGRRRRPGQTRRPPRGSRSLRGRGSRSGTSRSGKQTPQLDTFRTMYIQRVFSNTLVAFPGCSRPCPPAPPRLTLLPLLLVVLTLKSAQAEEAVEFCWRRSTEDRIIISGEGEVRRTTEEMMGLLMHASEVVAKFLLPSRVVMHSLLLFTILRSGGRVFPATQRRSPN